MNQVVALEIEFDFGNGVNRIYPTILKDDREMVLVDCGHPHLMPYIKKAAEDNEINIDKLTRIVITHHDYDHMGALAEFKRTYPNIKVVSSYIEEKYISGKEKSLRLQQAEALYDSLPEDQKAGAEKFHSSLKAVSPVEVDILVKDHDIFSWCGGTEIVATPGHMPGHISLYLKETKTLIAGDAFVAENGKLCIANPQYTLDMEEAKNSIKKLLDYDIQRVICYHGGICTENVKEYMEGMLK